MSADGVTEHLPTIGIVGLGPTAGAAVAQLLDRGFLVVAFDDDPERVAAATAAGVAPAQLPADAAESADLVIVDMPDERSAEEALFDFGGVGETLRDGGYVLDFSPTGPAFAADATDRLANIGLVRVQVAPLDTPSSARGDGAPSVLGCPARGVDVLSPVLQVIADQAVAAELSAALPSSPDATDVRSPLLVSGAAIPQARRRAGAGVVAFTEQTE